MVGGVWIWASGETEIEATAKSLPEPNIKVSPSARFMSLGLAMIS
jgi:hypothetical protein